MAVARGLAGDFGAPAGALCRPSEAVPDCRLSATRRIKAINASLLTAERGVPSFKEIGTAQLILMGE
jgi:hypothetical protein